MNEVSEAILKYINKIQFPEWHNLKEVQQNVLTEKELDYGTIRRSLEDIQKQGFIEIENVNNDEKLRFRLKGNSYLNFSLSEKYIDAPIEKKTASKMGIAVKWFWGFIIPLIIVIIGLIIEEIFF